MSVTLVSSTQSESEMAEALANPRYGLEVEAPPPTESAAPTEPLEKKPSEKPADTPVESKTDAAQEPAKSNTQEQEEDGPEPEPKTDEEAKAPVPHYVQRQLSRTHAKLGKERGLRQSAEAQAAQLRQELEALKTAAPKPPDPAPPPVPVPPVAEVKPAAPEPKPKPKVEDFPDSYEDYVEALVDWKADEKVTAALAEADKKIAGLETKLAEADTIKEKVAVANDIWVAKVDKAKAKIPDFDTVMSSEAAQKLMVPPIVQSAIAESDVGPEVGHYLLTHPDDATRIFQAVALKSDASQEDVRKAFRKVGFEIGRIEELLNAAPAAPAPATVTPSTPEKPKPVQTPVSKAPPPITPVGTRSAASVSSEPPSNSSDYLRWRQEQLAKRN